MIPCVRGPERKFSRFIHIPLLILLTIPCTAQAQAVFTDEPVWASAATGITYDVALGDVDGDGDLDLVCGNVGKNTLYLNTGRTFQTVPAWTSVSQKYSFGIALGDMDGDGDLDLACGNYSGSEMYINEGGTFGATPDGTGPALTEDIVLGDVDGDGDLDCVLGRRTNNLMYLNIGGAFPEMPSWTSSEAYWTESVALGDIDNDGDLDLVCLNDSTQTPVGSPCTVHLNNGGTLSQTADWVSRPLGSFVQGDVNIGDVTGDGIVDFILAGDEFRLYRGGNTLSTTPDWVSTATNGHCSALGDVDLDGDLDLVYGNYTSIGLFRNTAGTLSAAPVWTVQSDYAMGIALGDVDGDGDLDLVVATDGAEVMYRNETAVLPSSYSWITNTSIPANDISAVDLNGDAHPDLICGNSGSTDIFMNNGGTFPTTPSATIGLGYDTQCFSTGDVDKDGDIDLFCGNFDQENTLFLNHEGSFSPTPDWTTAPGSETRAMALFDADNNGFPDVLFGGFLSEYAARRFTLRLNNGGTFSDAADWLSDDTHFTHALATGDVDKDGRIDFVFSEFAASSEGSYGLYLNKGGWFSFGWGLSTVNVYSANDVQLADINCDGTLDLISANNEANTVFYGNGRAFPNSPSWSDMEGDISLSCAAGDIDGDGDLDLFSGNSYQRIKLYQNSGGSLVRNASWSAYTSTPNAIDVADIDDDGDNDLICSEGGFGGRRAPAYKKSLLFPTCQLTNNPAFIKDVSVRRVDDNRYLVSFMGFDVESDRYYLLPQYQFEGSGQWRSANADGQYGRAGYYLSSPSGVRDSLTWDATDLPFDRRNVVLRLKMLESPSRTSTIQHVPFYSKELGSIQPLRPEVRTSTSNLAFPTLTVGDTASVSFVVTNGGNVDLSITGINLPISEMRHDALLPLTVAPGDQDTIMVFLEPRYELEISGPLAIMSNDPLTPAYTIAVAADIRALDVATKLLKQSESVPLGEAVTVVIRPAPDVRVEKGHLLYRRADASGAFADSIVLSHSYDEFVAIIPGEDVTESGLEYYVRVENSGVFAVDPHGAPEDSFFTQAVMQPASIISHAVAHEGGRFIESREITVNVTVPVGTVVESGMLFYNGGGRRPYMSVPLQMDEMLPYAVIPDSVVGERGVEYWVQIETATRTLTDPPADPSVRPHSIQVTVGNCQEPNGHPAGEYRMLSMPMALGGQLTWTLEDNLGPPDPAAWRLFLYDAGTHAYAELPNDSISSFESGRSYWLITKGPHRVDTGPAEGVSTPLDSAFAITLEPGYNMIGNPFAFGVAWDSCTVEAHAMTEAESMLVEPPVRWSGSSGYEFDVEVLEPFDGVWVKNLCDSSVTLRIPPREAPQGAGEGGAEAAIQTARTDGGSWGIEIHASSGDAKDWGNRVGVRAGSSTEWDKFDRSEPPMTPSRALSLYFPHTSWRRHPGNYSADIRGGNVTLEEGHPGAAAPGEETAGHAWSFDVAKNFSDEGAGDPVVLEFLGTRSIPPDLKVCLIDRTLQETMDIGSTARYEFFLGERGVSANERDARFVLLVGTEEYIQDQNLPKPPARTALYQNYPNPFNPSTIIRYDLAKRGRVSVRVFDVTGALVKILEDREREPGRYEIPWNGEDERGSPVGSGVYFCRLDASGFSQTRKLLLIK